MCTEIEIAHIKFTEDKPKIGSLFSPLILLLLQFCSIIEIKYRTKRIYLERIYLT